MSATRAIFMASKRHVPYIELSKASRYVTMNDMFSNNSLIQTMVCFN